MGATLNMRPDLFRCVVAGVPFVDVMVSMCDPSIPLTTGEWEEWGNPNEEVYFEYMLKYAPMENIAKSDKPDVLITAGLHDPRVAYWEAAKYAARLRDSVTNGARVLLKTDLSAGHFSASDVISTSNRRRSNTRLRSNVSASPENSSRNGFQRDSGRVLVDVTDSKKDDRDGILELNRFGSPLDAVFVCSRVVKVTTGNFTYRARCKLGKPE